MTTLITFSDFEKVDIRVGKVLEVKDFPEAKRPSYKLKIDFGDEIGIKSSSAQICDLYSADELIGKSVVAVVNFPPKRIGSFVSEVLVLGVPDNQGRCVLIQPEREVNPGGKVY